MRVIAGIYRSRKLQTLRGMAMRPSSDRLRETLFNILGPGVQNSVFVDLFAGSGAVGIEALSRGAHHAIFAESHPAGVALLRRNLSALGVAPGGNYAPTNKASFGGTAEVLPTDVGEALEWLDERGLRADLLFADPPYADSAAYEEVLGFLGDSELIVPGGRAILEHSRRRTLPAVEGSLERIRVVEHGDSVLSIYRVVQAA